MAWQQQYFEWPIFAVVLFFNFIWNCNIYYYTFSFNLKLECLLCNFFCWHFFEIAFIILTFIHVLVLGKIAKPWHIWVKGFPCDRHNLGQSQRYTYLIYEKNIRVKGFPCDWDNLGEMISCIPAILILSLSSNSRNA